MKVNSTGWNNPVLGEDAEAQYAGIYGSAGKEFLRILKTTPNEIGMVSRLIACLHEAVNGKE